MQSVPVTTKVVSSLVFSVMFCISFLVLLSFFLLTNCVVCLQFTASDYPIGIFKPFLSDVFVASRILIG
jgi:hypothetical protein